MKKADPILVGETFRRSYADAMVTFRITNVGTLDDGRKVYLGVAEDDFDYGGVEMVVTEASIRNGRDMERKYGVA